MGSGSKRSGRADDSDSISEEEMSISEEETDVDSEMESEENDIDIPQNLVQKDDELEDLEKEYSNLQNQQQDLLASLKRHKDEDLLKGQAVKNQKVLWDKTLELRFLLQRAFSSSNRLPQEPMKSQFCSSDKAVDQAYSDLITTSEQTVNSLLELQEAMLEKNPSITKAGNGTKETTDEGKDASDYLDGEADEEWSNIYKMHCRIAPFRNSSVDKWQRKTQVTTGAAAFRGKLHAFNQNISEQVAQHMRDPSRMVKRMQSRRSTILIFGDIPEGVEGKKEEENADGDPELLDDSEFYQQLLKEFFESCDPNSSEQAFYALRKLQPKKRKYSDQRASKGRKIRYNEHEKLKNFMAREPMNLPSMAPKLFDNLFGQQSKKSTPVPG